MEKHQSKPPSSVGPNATKTHDSIDRSELIPVSSKPIKAEINLAEEDGWTPLYVASQNGHIEVVKALIASRAKVGIKSKSGGDSSAFFVACENQDILKFIAYQKLQNLSEIFFDNVLIQRSFINLIKAQTSFEQLISFIIKNQGNLDVTEQGQITLLMMAVAMKSYAATKKLLVAGASKNLTDVLPI